MPDTSRRPSSGERLISAIAGHVSVISQLRIQQRTLAAQGASAWSPTMEQSLYEIDRAARSGVVLLDESSATFFIDTHLSLLKDELRAALVTPQDGYPGGSPKEVQEFLASGDNPDLVAKLVDQANREVPEVAQFLSELNAERLVTRAFSRTGLNLTDGRSPVD